MSEGQRKTGSMVFKKVMAYWNIHHAKKNYCPEETVTLSGHHQLRKGTLHTCLSLPSNWLLAKDTKG